MAATGSVALYHVEGITPEAEDFSTDGLERIEITSDDIDTLKERLIKESKPDALVIGCPHLSKKELEKIAGFLEGREKSEESPDLLVYTSRGVKEDTPGAVKTIERFGTVISDTCMVVSPLEEKYDVVATNSGKATEYLPKLSDQKVIYGDLETLMGMIE